jgi:hypothetical protein
MRRGRAALRAIAGKRTLQEPRLDQLFAEPIVKQLMRRDRIDEATIRHLLRQAAVARAVPRVEGLLALVMGLPLPAGIRYAWDIAMLHLSPMRSSTSPYPATAPWLTDDRLDQLVAFATTHNWVSSDRYDSQALGRLSGHAVAAEFDRLGVPV